MGINGIGSVGSDVYTNNVVQSVQKEVAKEESKKDDSTGVIYESSAKDTTKVKKEYKTDPKLIEKLKADSEAKVAQFRSMVEKMLTQQGKAFNNANDIWGILRSGNFTVDAATKEQAQKDIAEDGYWGVKQTSERILDFAKALTGGDPSKIESMKKAFEKGYQQADRTWGGELPEISKKTYEAVLNGFDEWSKENA